MLSKHNPATIMAPVARYSMGVEAAPDMRWLLVSGQVGVNPDGELAADDAAQVETAWRNVLAVIESAGMGPADIVKVNIYLTDRDNAPAVREARDRILGDIEPAATMVIVAGLARPEWVVEIEAVAAAAP